MMSGAAAFSFNLRSRLMVKAFFQIRISHRNKRGLGKLVKKEEKKQT